MRPLFSSVIVGSATALFALLAHGQDTQSPADAARQPRQQKQVKTRQSETKDAPPSQAKKVITNDDMPQRFNPATKTPGADQDQDTNPPEPSREQWKMSAEQWKAQVERQKNLISSMQGQIDQMTESIRFAPANCRSNCVQWKERQREKQQQVDQMRSQLEEDKKQLEDMQEQARKQGYGGSVYDPD